MSPSRGESNTPGGLPQATEEDPFVPIIIDSLRSSGHLAPLRPTRAWERAVPPPTTPGDVKAAWLRAQAAHKSVRVGADPEVFDLAMGDFRLKLEAWLRS